MEEEKAPASHAGSSEIGSDKMTRLPKVSICQTALPERPSPQLANYERDVRQTVTCHARQSLGEGNMAMGEDVKLTATPAGRSPAAERMRQHRERRRQGLRCLLIEISEAEIEGLIREGLLTAELRNNVYAVSWALYDHLDRTLVHRP